MATFADLMSLLMCFFVLLLSFSEMDVLKYKQIAGSMAQAFGVQDKVNAKDIPKGTSVIAQEFSPGRPEPTPINEVRQSTTSSGENTLDIRISEPINEAQSETFEENPPTESPTESEEALRDRLLAKLQVLIQETQDDARELADALKKEISSGKIDIETKGRRIVIRVREQGSFPSGSSELRSEFVPVMATVRDVIKDIPGRIAIEGHTDSVPVAGGNFRSNWDLSAARAVSVALELFKGNDLDPNRFVVTGYADSKPLVANDTEENRARNRRVEIVIHQGLDDEAAEDVRALQELDPGLVEALDLNTPFTLSEDEIF